ncbi:MerR family transcriptional regulator [Microbacterium sp. KR10-403]|uniref:MerR family transcriptional regulator n=1 Tax=Microbacterium sp. KR10-403 TaxID=3158581 RepID=UPI0032E4A95B
MISTFVCSLRYYEQQGLLMPQRSSAGHRSSEVDEVRIVGEIQELFDAGFCSSVIRELLPAISELGVIREQLAGAFQAARQRLESERAAVEGELERLASMAVRFGLATDMGVRVETDLHDDIESAQAAPFDHRDRRLR